MNNTSIKKNYFYSMMYQILIMILPLITAPYLARVVGAKGVGIYSYSFSVAQYFVYFSMLGVSNLGNRSIAKIRDNIEERNRVFSEIYTMQIISSCIVILIYLIYCFFIASSYKLIAFLQIFFVISAVFDVSWLFFGMEDFKLTVTRQIFIKILTTICILVFVKTDRDVWKYTLILSLGTFIGQVYLYISAKKYISFKISNLNAIKKYIKSNLVLFIPIIATSIYRVMDKVMIGAITNVTEVGYYENSDKLVATCLGIIGSLGSVMLPHMTNLVSKGEKEKIKKYLTNSMEFTMFIACAIGLGIASVANEFIPIFYGNEFTSCINITKLLTISSLFISWANVIRMQYLIPNEKDKIYVTSIILGAIVNIIVNLILIRKLGAVGAAIGTICAEFTVMFYQTFKIRKEIPLRIFINKTTYFFVFGIIMYFSVTAITSLVENNVAKFFIGIFSGGFIYLIFSLVYFILTKNELLFNFYKRMVNKYVKN